MWYFRVINGIVLAILLMFPGILIADHVNVLHRKVIGLSKTGSRLAVRVQRNSSAGIFRIVEIYSLPGDRLVRKFVIQDPTKDPGGINRVQQRGAALYMRRLKITMKNFNKAYRRLRLPFPSTMVVGRGRLKLSSLIHGDSVALFYSEKPAGYNRLLFVRRHRLDRLFQYADRSRGLSNFLMMLNIKNILVEGFASRSRPDQLLVFYRYSHRFHGTNAEVRLLYLDLNNEINHALWQNVLGYRAYRVKRYRDAIKKFRLSLKADPEHHVARYNLACTHAILKEEQLCLKALYKLLGDWKRTRKPRILRFLRQIRTDSDFHPLRKSRGFRKFVQKLEVAGGYR